LFIGIISLVVEGPLCHHATIAQAGKLDLAADAALAALPESLHGIQIRLAGRREGTEEVEHTCGERVCSNVHVARKVELVPLKEEIAATFLELAIDSLVLHEYMAASELALVYAALAGFWGVLPDP
jgi:hypothetical protein